MFEILADGCTHRSSVQVLYFAPKASNASQGYNNTREACSASPAGDMNGCPYGTYQTSTYTSTTSFLGVSYGSSTFVSDGTTTSTDVSTSVTNTYTETMTQCVYQDAPMGQSNNTASIVSGGVTFYEDLVYLSLRSVWAVNSDGSTVGSPHSAQLISMRSESVYSVCTEQAGQAAFRYNFDDFNGYLPASAWNCQPYCEFVWLMIAKGGAPSQKLPVDTPEDLDKAISNPLPGDFFVNDKQIFHTSGGYCGPFPAQSWYKPYVAVPPQIRSLDPAWSTCVLALEGWYDPPKALSEVTTAPGPSSPGAESTSAQTAQVPSATYASLTSTTGTATSAPQASPSGYASDTSASLTSAPSAISTNRESSDSIATDSTQVPVPSPSAYTDSSSDAADTTQEGNSLTGTSTNPTGTAVSIVTAILQNIQQSTTAPPNTDSQTAVSADSSSDDPANTSQASDAGGQTTAAATTVLVNDNTFTVSQASSGDGVIVNGGTVASNDPETTIAGQVVSVGSQDVQIGSTVVSQPPAQTPASVQTSAVIIANSQSITAIQLPSSSLQLIDASSTVIISNGGVATIGTQAVSAASSGAYVVFDQTTAQLTEPASSNDPSAATVAIRSQTLSAVQQGSSVVVAHGSSSITVAQGATATLAGQTMSVGSGDGQTAIGSSTVSLPPVPSDNAASVVATADGNTITAIRSGSSVIFKDSSSTITVAQDSTAILGDQTVAAPSQGDNVIIGTSVVALSAVPSASPTGVLTTDAHTLTAVQKGSSVILAEGSSTFTLAGGSSVTLAGQTIAAANGGSGVIIGTKTLALAQQSQAGASAVFTAGGYTFTAQQSGNSILVADASSTITLDRGATATMAGQTLVAQSTGLVVGGSSVNLDPIQGGDVSVATIPVGGHTLTAVQTTSGAVLFAERSATFTVADGQSTTFAGQVIAAQSDGTVLVDGSTMSLSTTPSSEAPSAMITTDRHTITTIQRDGSVVFAEGSSTLSLADGETTHAFGQTIAADSSGHVLIDGSTATLSTPTSEVFGAVITSSAGQAIIMLQEGSSYVVENGDTTQTLAAGASVTFDGETISAPATGSSLLVNGRTIGLSYMHSSTAPKTISGANQDPSTNGGGPASTSTSITSGARTWRDRHFAWVAIGLAFAAVLLS